PGWTESLAAWCQQAGVPCYRDHTDLPSALDLVVSCYYDKILREDFIARQHRVINLHNSPLPKYRGVNPINWALKNGEREHGVTIHEIIPAIDAGPIIAQVKFTICPEIEEVRDVYHKAIEYGWVLFRTTIPLLDRIIPVEQDHAQATYYGIKDR